MNEVQAVNRRSLSHLTENEKRDALAMLVLVGIKHFSLLFGKRPIDVSTLEQLSEKYTNEFQNNSKFQTPNGRKIYSEDLRKSRPDVLSHFPFSDETGTVTDILGGQSEGEMEAKSGMHKLLLMGKPGRLRLIERTFQEMRLNQVGIRLCDLPEALNRLDLHVSNALKLHLEDTRSNYLLDGSMKNYDEQHKTFTRERFISHEMFAKLVGYFLRRAGKGRQTESIRHSRQGEMDDLISCSNLVCEELDFIHSVLNGSSNTAGVKRGSDKRNINTSYAVDSIFNTVSNRHENEEEDECYDEVNDENNVEQGGSESDNENDSLEESSRPSKYTQHGPQNNTQRTNNSRQRTQNKRNQNSNQEQQYYSDHDDPPPQTKQSSKSGSKSGRPASKSGPQFGQQYLRQISAVPSKIGGLVRQDRKEFMKNQSSTSRSALASLARRRVDVLTSMLGPEHLRERRPATSVPGNKQQRQHQPSAAQQRAHRQRISDLTSGMAVTEIADAFLSGPVGRELMFNRDFKGEEKEEEEEPYYPTESHRSTALDLQQKLHKQSQHARQQYRDDVYTDDTVNINNVVNKYSKIDHTLGNDDHSSDLSTDQVYLRDGKLKPYHYSAHHHYGSEDRRDRGSERGGALNTIPVTNYSGRQKNDDHLGYGHTTTAVKSRQSQIDRESRHLYAPNTMNSNSIHNQQHQLGVSGQGTAKGWKASKGKGGGWVADFGPEHTHDNYAGPSSEIYTSSGYEYKPWRHNNKNILNTATYGAKSSPTNSTTLNDRYKEDEFLEKKSSFSPLKESYFSPGDGNSDKEEEEEEEDVMAKYPAFKSLPPPAYPSSQSPNNKKSPLSRGSDKGSGSPRATAGDNSHLIDSPSEESAFLQQMYAEVENRKIDRQLLEGVRRSQERQEPFTTANLTQYTQHYNKHTSADINHYTERNKTEKTSFSNSSNNIRNHNSVNIHNDHDVANMSTTSSVDAAILGAGESGGSFGAYILQSSTNHNHNNTNNNKPTLSSRYFKEEDGQDVTYAEGLLESVTDTRETRRHFDSKNKENNEGGGLVGGSAKVTVRSRSSSPTALPVSGGSRLFRSTRNTTITTHIVSSDTNTANSTTTIDMKSVRDLQGTPRSHNLLSVLEDTPLSKRTVE